MAWCVSLLVVLFSFSLFVLLSFFFFFFSLILLCSCSIIFSLGHETNQGTSTARQTDARDKLHTYMANNTLPVFIVRLRMEKALATGLCYCQIFRDMSRIIDELRKWEKKIFNFDFISICFD